MAKCRRLRRTTGRIIRLTSNTIDTTGMCLRRRNIITGITGMYLRTIGSKARENRVTLPEKLKGDSQS